MSDAMYDVIYIWTALFNALGELGLFSGALFYIIKNWRK
jgi:hypothetical protein